MNTPEQKVRQEFESVYRVPPSVEYITTINLYQAREPYTWGADSAANTLNTQWITWQHQQSTIDAQRDEIAADIRKHGV